MRFLGLGLEGIVPDTTTIRLFREQLRQQALVEGLFERYQHINERAYRNRPLTEEQTASHRAKSKVRAKVEHVFGDWVAAMDGKLVRSIGLAQAKVNLGLKNLAINLKRYVFWEKQEAQVWAEQHAQ